MNHFYIILGLMTLGAVAFGISCAIFGLRQVKKMEKRMDQNEIEDRPSDKQWLADYLRK